MKLNKKCFISMLMAMVMIVSLSFPASAAKNLTAHTFVAVAPGNSFQEYVSGTTSVQPRGSLSGWGAVGIEGTPSVPKSFVFDVSGSWSPCGHARVKSEGFSDGTTIDISVSCNNQTKFTKTLGPNSDIKDIVYWNADAGAYTVTVKVNGNKAIGLLQVWIY